MPEDLEPRLEPQALDHEPRPGAGPTFAALQVRNFRLFFTGQSISLIGTWMQSVALAWLVLTISHSGTTLGLVVAAQFTPVLLLGAYGGLIADRVDKRRLLIATQSALALLALLLGLLTVTHSEELWMLFVIAPLLGLVQATDNPTRQSFVAEMVGRDLVQNAVSLNSALVNASRAVGPAVAGVLIAAVGVPVCFFINAFSFVAVIVALTLMRPDALRPVMRVARGRGQLREGFRYVRATPGLFAPLVMMALVGTLAYEFQVLLPLLARITYEGGPGTFGLLTSAMGAGAVAGGLVVARRSSTGLTQLSIAAAVFGTTLLVATLANTVAFALPLLVATGFASTSFLATGNSTLQLTSEPRFRGRVMALWSVAFLGSTPIGGPIVGATAEWLGPRSGLVLGGVACWAAAGIGAYALTRLAPEERRLARVRPPATLDPTLTPPTPTT